MNNFSLKNLEDNSSPFIRGLRIFLLVLIVIGIGLIFTQNLWVPKLVDYILAHETQPY